MKPIDIIKSENSKKILYGILDRLHFDGPVFQEDLETLSYLKYFHKDVFEKEEKKLMYLLGLFYKIEEPDDLLSFSYSIYSRAITEETGKSLTPVQSSIRNKILTNKYYSFSAPTSAGKSFIFRELIYDQNNDIVIVVPSRALIAEYMLVVKEMVADRKDILVLQFVDDVNKKKTNRKIFIVTPERASEVFRKPERFNFSLFLFDEAQISEEKVRGTTFDAFVRRADKVFPGAKKVFAHPFVENPNAQLNKHSFTEESGAMAYKQNTVGKIYLGYDKKNNIFECFSPFIEKSHYKINKTIFEEDIVKNKLLDGGSALIYITKKSIYERTFEDDFKHYISLCKTIENPEALEIIDEVEELIVAKDKKSELVELMRKGVVVHHGSIPLNVRYLIEKFINKNFARICFATSTLIHGVNMPFDVIWIENVRLVGSDEDKTLGLKNLIGRAGRTTLIKNKFDFGFVIVKNIKNFTDKFNGTFQLSEKSQLDKDSNDIPEDLKEFIDAVKKDSFNNEYNLPISKADRLKSKEASDLIKVALNFLFKEEKIMEGSEYNKLSDTEKLILKQSMAGIYELSLGRNLFSGEKTILSASITILLWHIQGKSFKELLGLRYSYLTNLKEQRKLKKELKEENITEEEYADKINKLIIEYSAIPYQLPDSSLKTILPSRFGQKTVRELNYDLVVYDTYDFLDKVISFSLSDVFIAAFDQYYITTKDERAKNMVDYLRYGTIDEVEIWLMRYGFSIEEAELIKVHVLSIDEKEILFSQSIYDSKNTKIKEMVERYI